MTRPGEMTGLCLADVAAFGLCLRDRGHAGKHRDANGHEFLDPAGMLAALGAKWSPDLDAYAAGDLDASAVRCVLCHLAPCQCPPFGTPGYFALTDACHGRGPAPLSDDPAAQCPAECGHFLTVHSADLGCWLCVCSHGQDVSSRAPYLPADVCARRLCTHESAVHLDGTGACGDCGCQAFITPPVPLPASPEVTE